MAVIEHTGRKSGNLYRIPVMAFVDGQGFSVVLNYGTRSDWVRNVLAAGSADVVHRGKRYRLTNPRIVPTDSAELPPVIRAMRRTDRRALHGVLAGLAGLAG
ncbi:nitroreductase family deazaflavin-dependent oxidoreductase [Mycolicibacterium sp. CBMA 234]|uniref:nitroreductase family deazaflavin-dependent oxidoreductase n=1 Tax=Mycolicibacterium sp. CBMA 234 TaxID=1918495 RepID=UPI001EE430F6|nr:nitroreductase family deazaflavin-dependent oxidoreductase [Mycolicibacterium sp. CBMA 234]